MCSGLSPNFLKSLVFTVLVIIGVNFSHSLAANQVFFDINRYSIDSGLPDTTVFSITRDNDGYLWLGTPNGLSRFNGRSFDNFSQQSPQETEVATQDNSNIFIDSQQRIWVGTWGNGVYVYDRFLNLLFHLSTSSDEKHQIRSNLVQTFFEDSQSNVWIGTNGGGLALFKSDSQQVVNFVHDDENEASISHNRIWHIAQDHDQKIWVATGSGLDYIAADHTRTVTRLSQLIEPDSFIYKQRIRRLLITPESFWIGTEKGFCKLNSTRFQCQPIAQFNAENFTDVRITNIVQGKTNQLWIGTLSGLYLYDTQENSFVPLANAKMALLPHDDIRDVYYDPEGAIWVASRPSGLIKISFIGDSITGFTEFRDDDQELKPIGRVSALLRDKDQTLWIGSTQGLLTMTAQQPEPIIYEDDIGLINAMMEDAQGNLWLASNKGVFRKSQQQSGFESLNQDFDTPGNYQVLSLFQDSAGNVWIGTLDNGLFVIENDDIVPVSLNGYPQLNKSTITAIVEDRYGFVVIAIAGTGILHFSPNSDRQVLYKAGEDSALRSNAVVDMLTDGDKNLWVASNNQLSRLDDISNTFDEFPRKERLANLVIKKLLKDPRDNIWFSTATGIIRLNADRTSVERFTLKNGLHGDQFVTQSGYAADNGDLYFGGATGFTQIKTSSLQTQTTDTKIVINHIKAGQQYFHFLRDSEQEEHSFNHTLKDIQFTFSDLNLLSNSPPQFRFRLLGHNNTWSDKTQQSTINYSGLPPGQYRFQVTSESELLEPTEIAEFSFEILPPWWKTWEAIVAYILLVVLIVTAWVRWRLMSLRASNLRLENEVKMRSDALIQAETQLIESEKNASLTSLIVGVAHEINTPMGISVTASSVIEDQATRLLELFSQNQITRKDFETRLGQITDSAKLISKSLKKADNLIQSFKNLSTDQLSQSARTINFNQYLHEILSNLGPTIERAGIRWVIKCEPDIVFETYPGAIAQLITQLALNAIEHAFVGITQPQITIRVLKRESFITIRFEDNGVGIGDELKEKVFMPFFTTRRQHGNIGLGLQIIANIVTIRLNGNVRVEDNSPHGTVIVCEIQPH